MPHKKADLLKVAFDGLAVPFANFLASACAQDRRKDGLEGFDKRPDWIMVDFAHHWLCPIADEHQVNCTCLL